MRNRWFAAGHARLGLIAIAAAIMVPIAGQQAGPPNAKARLLKHELLPKLRGATPICKVGSPT